MSHTPSSLDRTRRSPHGDGERERLIEATFAVIAADDTTDPSVRAILKEAELSTPAFYRHFRSKDELLCAVLDEGFNILIGYLQHRMEKAAGGLGAVCVFIEGLAAQTKNARSRSRTTPWALNQSRLQHRFPEQMERSTADVTALLTAAIERANAEGSSASPDPASDALMIYDYTMAAMRRALARERSIDNATTKTLVGFAFRAIGAEA